MTGMILIDGRPSDGRIPVTDSSVLRGDGCFEVLKAYRGRPFGLEDHLDRLQASATALEISLPDRTALAEWIRQSAEESGDCAVRVVVTRGASVPGVEDPARVIVFAHPWDVGDRPARLYPVMAPWHAAGVDWDLAGAKIISYAPNLAATRKARSHAFDDALLVTIDDLILEGPTFSVAWLVDGVLETPTLELGILDSITRRHVLDIAREHGLTVVEGQWPLSRLGEATEVMALSTIREVQPVAAVGDVELDAGPVTALLSKVFAELVSRA